MDEIERKLFNCKEQEKKIIVKIEQDDLKTQALEILARKIYINSRGNLGIIDNFLNNKEKHVLYKFLYKKDKKKTKYCITYEEN